MITLKRAGKTYEITEADQQRIADILIICNGDMAKAISKHFEEKFGEKLGPKADPNIE